MYHARILALVAIICHMGVTYSVGGQETSGQAEAVDPDETILLDIQSARETAAISIEVVIEGGAVSSQGDELKAVASLKNNLPQDIYVCLDPDGYRKGYLKLELSAKGEKAKFSGYGPTGYYFADPVDLVAIPSGGVLEHSIEFNTDGIPKNLLCEEIVLRVEYFCPIDELQDFEPHLEVIRGPVYSKPSVFCVNRSGLVNILLGRDDCCRDP